MCDPLLTTTAIGAAAGPGTALGAGFSASTLLGTAFTIVSTAVSAIGQMQQARAQSDHLAYQAQMQEYNAKVAENNAILSRQAAEADADTIDRQRRIALAQQAAGFAASGVVINEGSTLEVFGDTAAEFELEHLNRLHEGKLQSNAQRIQATMDRNNAAGLLAQSTSASSAGKTKAFGTILGGAEKIVRSMPGTERVKSSLF